MRLRRSASAEKPAGDQEVTSSRGSRQVIQAPGLGEFLAPEIVSEQASEQDFISIIFDLGCQDRLRRSHRHNKTAPTAARAVVAAVE